MLIAEKTHDHALAHMIGMRGRHAPQRIDRSTTKKAWDDFQGDLRAHPLGAESIVEVAPSQRAHLRQRQRDQLAMGRKSRRKAFRNAQAERHNEQNLHGMAQVYYDVAPHSPAMEENVGAAVWAFAEKHAEIKEIPVEQAVQDVENALQDMLVAYGDVEDPRGA